MHSVEAETLINARSATVWEIITDARNYTVWESGITHFRGELRNGGTIRIRTHTGGNRAFRLRVRQMPGEVMTWTMGLPLGLLTGVRTFTLEPLGGMTYLRVKEEFTGPLCGLLLWEFVSDTQQAFIASLRVIRSYAYRKAIRHVAYITGDSCLDEGNLTAAAVRMRPQTAAPSEKAGHIPDRHSLREP